MARSFLEYCLLNEAAKNFLGDSLKNLAAIEGNKSKEVFQNIDKLINSAELDQNDIKKIEKVKKETNENPKLAAKKPEIKEIKEKIVPDASPAKTGNREELLEKIKEANPNYRFRWKSDSGSQINVYNKDGIGKLVSPEELKKLNNLNLVNFRNTGGNLTESGESKLAGAAETAIQEGLTTYLLQLAAKNPGSFEKEAKDILGSMEKCNEILSNQKFPSQNDFDYFMIKKQWAKAILSMSSPKIISEIKSCFKKAPNLGEYSFLHNNIKTDNDAFAQKALTAPINGQKKDSVNPSDLILVKPGANLNIFGADYMEKWNTALANGDIIGISLKKSNSAVVSKTFDSEHTSPSDKMTESKFVAFRYSNSKVKFSDWTIVDDICDESGKLNEKFFASNTRFKFPVNEKHIHCSGIEFEIRYSQSNNSPENGQIPDIMIKPVGGSAYFGRGKDSLEYMLGGKEQFAKFADSILKTKGINKENVSKVMFQKMAEILASLKASSPSKRNLMYNFSRLCALAAKYRLVSVPEGQEQDAPRSVDYIKIS